MFLIRSIGLCALLCGFCFSHAVAQRKSSSFSEQTSVAPVLDFHSTQQGTGGTKKGTIWSGIGAFTGSVLGIPLSAALGLTLCESYDSSEVICSLVLVPLGIGAGVGAALGAETGGDRRAWTMTMIGAAIGTAVAIAIPEPINRGAVVELGVYILPPAIGAWVGNRLGQLR